VVEHPQALSQQVQPLEKKPMQQSHSSTDLAPAQYLTAGEVYDLAQTCGGYAVSLYSAENLRVVRRGYTKDFRAIPGGLFKAAPIRAWLEA